MTQFLNLTTLILLTCWAVCFIFLRIGNAAHPMLAFALLVALANLVRSGLSAK
jgi:hypothetical protein